MSKEIIFNCTEYETRIAILEDRVLSNFYVERVDERSIAANIYKGKVVRVLPGIQAAFVDIGIERSAFLYVADIYNETSGTMHPTYREYIERRTGDPCPSIQRATGNQRREGYHTYIACG